MHYYYATLCKVSRKLEYAYWASLQYIAPPQPPIPSKYGEFGRLATCQKGHCQLPGPANTPYGSTAHADHYKTLILQIVVQSISVMHKRTLLLLS